MTQAAFLGWGGIARLGLVQTGLGAVVVLTTSVLNRLMVVEFALPATLSGALVGVYYAMQMLRPGEATRAHRHTGSYLYTVAKGSGHSIINGQRFDWSERDIFCVPSWAWHEHANASATEDACLFCLSDVPVMRALGLHREQAFADNGGHQPIL